MLRSTLKFAALAIGLTLSGTALAATSAVVTTDLNVRTGPSSAYQRYGTIPAGSDVTVYGCLSGYNWCDINWAGGRGWVSGNYLAYLGQRYYRQPISTIGISVGVPVLGFDPYDYHRRYYTGRSWYHERYLDRPPIRRDVRQERREDWRQERRDDGWRQPRNEDRRDWREEPGDDPRGGRDVIDYRNRGDRFDDRGDRGDRFEERAGRDREPNRDDVRRLIPRGDRRDISSDRFDEGERIERRY